MGGLKIVAKTTDWVGGDFQIGDLFPPQTGIGINLVIILSRRLLQAKISSFVSLGLKEKAASELFLYWPHVKV